MEEEGKIERIAVTTSISNSKSMSTLLSAPTCLPSSPSTSWTIEIATWGKGREVPVDEVEARKRIAGKGCQARVPVCCQENCSDFAIATSSV